MYYVCMYMYIIIHAIDEIVHRGKVQPHFIMYTTYVTQVIDLCHIGILVYNSGVSVFVALLLQTIL